MMTPDEIAAAVDEYEQQGGGKKGSQTMQTRRIIKALTLIGVKRSDFKARVDRIREGRDYIYGHAMGSIRSREGQDIVVTNAQTLVKCGVSVTIIERGDGKPPMAFVSSKHPYCICRYSADTGTTSYE